MVRTADCCVRRSEPSTAYVAQPGSYNEGGAGRNIVILKRPVRVSSFISAMQSAVLARARQHELRDQLVAREKVEAHAHMLASEMKHRVKNTLTMVGVVASQTFRTRVGGSSAHDVFRLSSMARAQDLLTQNGQDSADLHHLIDQALEPYGRSNETQRFENRGTKGENYGKDGAPCPWPCTNSPATRANTVRCRWSQDGLRSDGAWTRHMERGYCGLNGVTWRCTR